MTDFILILVLLVLLGSAAFYVIRSRKQGRKCIGCPYAKDLPNGTCPCHSRQ